MLKLIYTWTIASIMMILIFMLVIGCETRNPVCSENYCVIGAIFPRSEIGDGQFEELPASVDEETVVGLLAGKHQESAAIADTTPVASTRSRFVSARPASGSEILPKGEPESKRSYCGGLQEKVWRSHDTVIFANLYPTVTKKPRTNYGYAPEGGLSFYEKTAHGCYFEKRWHTNSGTWNDSIVAIAPENNLLPNCASKREKV